MACVAELLIGDGRDSAASTQGEAALMASSAQTLDNRQQGSELQLLHMEENSMKQSSSPGKMSRRRTQPGNPAVEWSSQLDPNQTKREGEWGDHGGGARLGCAAYRRRPWWLSAVWAKRRSRAEARGTSVWSEKGNGERLLSTD
jgi:hypothetical protein